MCPHAGDHRGVQGGGCCGHPEGHQAPGLYRDNGNENGNCRDYRDSIGIVLGLYWENIWIMEKRKLL